jgi:CHAD domain-containing protein
MAAPVLTRSLLAQPARATARLIGRAYLQRVLEEAARVEVPVEELTGAAASRAAERQREAVHDLHVALRHLRNWLRAWRPFLRNTVHRDAERRLQKLSRLAGQVRDLEVQRNWLTGERVERSRVTGATARSMVERIEAERAKAHHVLATRLMKRLGRAAGTLAEDLEDLDPTDLQDATEPTTASAMSQLIAEHAEELPPVLRRLRAGQGDEAHAARIAVRRLRYLLDTLGHRSPDVRLVTHYLTNIQEQLGELHDAQVLAARLESVSRKTRKTGRSRAKRHGVRRAGVEALRRMLRRRIASESRQVRRAIGGSGQARTMAATVRVVARLNGFNIAAVAQRPRRQKHAMTGEAVNSQRGSAG